MDFNQTCIIFAPEESNGQLGDRPQAPGVMPKVPASLIILPTAPKSKTVKIMARINKNGTLSGLMGNVVLRSYNNATFAYVRPEKVSNPQTRGQMLQRTKKQNIVNLYGRMKPALKDNFQGKTGRQSDYSMFVSCNLSQQPVYLSQREASFGNTAIVAPYLVSFGKLEPIEYHLEGAWLVSNIHVSGLQLTAQTSVCELVKAILKGNESWKAGDVLEFICCRQVQQQDAEGQIVYANAECDYANIELEPCERNLLSRFLGAIELRVNEEGFLCMKAEGSGGFAIVRKRNSGKEVVTGIQKLEVNNPILEHYCSEEQSDLAIKSYEIKKKRR